MLTKEQAIDRILDIFMHCKDTVPELIKGHVEHALREYAEELVRGFAETIQQSNQKSLREQLSKIYEV